MRAYRTLLKNELKMSLRGMDMLIFAVCMPLVILLILGLIYGDRPAFEGADFSFMEQSFGALCTIAVCAGGEMGLPLVLSDYREKKILKRYRVTPIRPAFILWVEVSMYAVYALVSLLTLSAAAFFFFRVRIRGNIGLFSAGYFLVMISMFSIGVMVGGIAKDSKTAGIIASVLYFPMLIFSGATLPYEVMPPVLQKAADIMPLTQGIKILKNAVLGLPPDNVTGPLIAMLAVSAVCVIISVKKFRWE